MLSSAREFLPQASDDETLCGEAGPVAPARNRLSSRKQLPVRLECEDWDVLIARSQRGDPQAYRQLLKEISPFLRAQAARFHRNRHDIEDAVQDALLSIHSVRHAHDAGRPFAPWLVTIARRRFTDRLRSQFRIRLHEVALDDEHHNVAAPAADSQEQRANARIVRQAVAKLPPAQREAIMLTKLEEMSLDEAAQVSGTSIAALKVSTHRGLRGLQKLLAPR